jgi:hypothetical protein
VDDETKEKKHLFQWRLQCISCTDVIMAHVLLFKSNVMKGLNKDVGNDENDGEVRGVQT